jgi:prolyl oligopeptidase
MTIHSVDKEVNVLPRTLPACATAILMIIACLGAPEVAPQSASHVQATASLAGKDLPPTATTKPVFDEYFGTKVSDPYRYMENLNDPDVVKWFKDQDDYTRAALERIPGRSALLARIEELDKGAPFRVFDVQRMQGGKYFYQKKLANENTAKLYVRDGLDGQEKLLIDPDHFVKESGTHFTLNYYAPSLDGRYVAYGVSPSGSEDAVIHILNLKSGQDVGETIDRSWYGGISWMPDNQSFMHVQFQPFKPGMGANERRLKTRVLLHRVGTNPDSDVPVFGFGVNPEIPLDATDGSFVQIDPRTPTAIACVNHGFSNDSTCYGTPVDFIGKPAVMWRKLFDVQDEVTNFEVRGDDLYVMTHKNAPRFKVLRTSLAHPDLVNAEMVVPPSDKVITGLVASPEALYVTESDGGTGKLLRISYSKQGAKEVSLPVSGSISIGGGDPRLSGLLLYLTSWTRAYSIYYCKPETAEVVDVGLQPTGPYDAPRDLESIEVKARSYDGVMIPLSIVLKKGTKLDGSHPAILGGYGAYAISMDPYFDPRLIAWLEHGGIMATAHVRGGGEYGEEWHQAGMLDKKQNTWKDFIACAEYLIVNEYTSPARIAGHAGSAGGILIGRAFTERPDLFAAALDDVGLSDMIRDMFSGDGPLNIPEYGGLDTADGFKNLLEISAYYKVSDQVKYPAVLLTTGINDPRVTPWEPGKMAARLQAATGSGKPILLRVDYQGGHGGIGATSSQYRELLADQWSFLLWQFGDPAFQPKQ